MDMQICGTEACTIGASDNITETATLEGPVMAMPKKQTTIHNRQPATKLCELNALVTGPTTKAPANALQSDMALIDKPKPPGPRSNFSFIMIGRAALYNELAESEKSLVPSKPSTA
mmetsp:Transcript_7373/g.17583  ORF Transcript_7373/g.17583 Transcript_7373/m.17583 type:complete len:116 (+) Transcript_7373:345-692(+)